jgi:hypothetical protein
MQLDDGVSERSTFLADDDEADAKTGKEPSKEEHSDPDGKVDATPPNKRLRFSSMLLLGRQAESPSAGALPSCVPSSLDASCAQAATAGGSATGAAASDSNAAMSKPASSQNVGRRLARGSGKSRSIEHQPLVVQSEDQLCTRS